MRRDLLVGKYTLESLTSGMYLTPLDLYREYVQNAADAIDCAIEMGLVSRKDAVITIKIRTEEKTITIEDNGSGIRMKETEDTLIDIGNSKKDYSRSRGFRGIGRLSGLGYCDSLTFSTSFYMEPFETKVTFDSKKLQYLLLPQNGKDESLSEVMEKVVTSETCKTKDKAHFFRVEMCGVNNVDGLLDKESIISYMRQNLPVAYDNSFVWGSVIKQKLNIEGVEMPEYKVNLDYDGEMIEITKPYENNILSDRVRKINDPIKDIKFRTIVVDDELCAVLWYADTEYLGTILNSMVKGIRLRHGNILFGDNNSLRKQFKEERFNGWLCGELIVCSNKVIPNSRRDDFEKNDTYLAILEQFREWSGEITRDIRKRSYERSLDDNSKQIVEKDTFSGGKVIDVEDDIYIKGEDQLDELSESEEVASSDLFSKLSILANMQKSMTKYRALNISEKLTNEQRVTYEKIFDLMYAKLNKKNADHVVQIILNEYVC